MSAFWAKKMVQEGGTCSHGPDTLCQHGMVKNNFMSHHSKPCRSKETYRTYKKLKNSKYMWYTVLGGSRSYAWCADGWSWGEKFSAAVPHSATRATPPICLTRVKSYCMVPAWVELQWAAGRMKTPHKESRRATATFVEHFLRGFRELCLRTSIWILNFICKRPRQRSRKAIPC